jgi:hypothetical protein
MAILYNKGKKGRTGEKPAFCKTGKTSCKTRINKTGHNLSVMPGIHGYIFLIEAGIICAWPVTPRDWDIQQAEENAQLRPVMNDLR